MSKDKRHANTEAEASSTSGEAVQGQSIETPAAVTATPNMVAFFHRNHPQNRSSYTIPGVPGLIGVQRDLVVGTTPFTSNTDLAGMPATITLGVELVQPKADNKVAREAAAAAKLIEKAEKAQAKLVASQAKALERQAKADAVLAAAKAKVAAAEAAIKPTDPVTA